MRQNNNKNGDMTNFFVSLLMQYPVINKISFKANRQLISFVFVVKQEIEKEPLDEFKRKWAEACHTLHYLQKVDAKHFTVDSQSANGLTTLTYVRDLGSLSFAELTLTARLLFDQFKRDLVVDKIKSASNRNNYEERILARMLDIARQQIIPIDLHIFRDEGKVVVADI